MEEDAKGGKGTQQALVSVLQEEIAFKGHTITAIRLEDGRLGVVLRWVCEELHLDPQGQVQRIQRTVAIADELLRVRVQPRGGDKPKRSGGPQMMPILTLRGFPTWILGINPGEVAVDPEHPEVAEHIRQMIIAYQVEAVDVLYRHFANKDRLALLEPGVVEASATVVIAERATPLEPAKPQEPESGATDEEQTTYYENLALWALWQANQYGQKWRGEVNEWRGSMEARLESNEAITGLLPEIIERLGPAKITPIQQGYVKGYVKRLHELTGKPYPTIYENIRLAFGPARYQDLLEADWAQIEQWFQLQIERAQRR